MNYEQGCGLEPGHTTEISVNKKDWLKEKSTFSLTNVPTDDFLEFNIKTYPGHKGVTNELLHLKRNGELVWHSAYGTINHKGQGVLLQVELVLLRLFPL